MTRDDDDDDDDDVGTPVPYQCWCGMWLEYEGAFHRHIEPDDDDAERLEIVYPDDDVRAGGLQAGEIRVDELRRDDELTDEERAAMEEFRRAEGLHTGWGGTIPNPVDPNGPPIPFTAHAATDPDTIAAIQQLVAAAYQHLSAEQLAPGSPNRAVAESQEQIIERIREQTRRRRRKWLGGEGGDGDEAD